MSSGVETAPTRDGAEESNGQSAAGEENTKQKSDVLVEASSENSLKKPPPTMQPRRPSSPQQDHAPNPTRKRSREESSSLQTSQGQSQISEIWKRYDLTDPALTCAHEIAELEAVQKQIWRPKKIVPYTGLSSLQS